jgi:hypothetical protein
MNILPQWWRKYFLCVEWLIAVMLTIIFVVWYIWFEGEAALSCFLNGNRPSIYGTAASIFGSLLGFAITATSIVLGFSTSDRLKVIRDSKQYSTLWKVFNSTIRALGIATIASFLALIFDRDQSPMPIFLYAVFFGATFSFFRLLRAIWVLENVIELISMPSK